MRTTFTVLFFIVVLGLAGKSDMATASSPCMEDQACWSWSTMGDHHRGVYVGSHATLRLVVVGPCQYSRMERKGQINWDRTPLLRGDMTALYTGCQK